MWKKKLKMKKFQFIVIGIIIIFATAILTSCISMGKEVGKLVDNVYKEDHADYYLIASKGTSELIKDKVDELKSIRGYRATDLDVYYGEETLLDFQDETYFIVLDNYKDLGWKITPIEGEVNELGPKKGEVWVEKIIADSHNVQIGGKYRINNENNDELKVASLINDSIKPNSMANAQFVYINSEDFDKLKGNTEVDFSVINTKENKEELTQIIDETFTSKDLVYNFKAVEDLKESATMIFGLVSGLGSIAAMFMLIVTVVIIRFFVRSTILSEYGAIGTYKSLGFTTKEISGFYSKCYLIIGSIAIIIGTFIGIPISKIMGNIIMEYLTKYNPSYKSIVAYMIVPIMTFALLWINVILALKKIKRITPVDALRIGTTSSKAKIKKSFIKNASSSFAVAINDIFRFKGRSLLIILVVTVSFYVSLVFLNMYHSFETLDDKAAAWVGTPTTHFIIEFPEGEAIDELLNYLDNSEYVNNYVYGALMVQTPIESLEESISLKTSWNMSFNTYEDGFYNINYRKGRPPMNKEEIGLDTTSLNGSDLNVGDYINLRINNKEEAFLITGTFDTVGGSVGAHFMNSYFEQFEEDYMNSAAILLKNKDDMKEFREDVKKHFPEYEVKKIDEYIGDVKNSIQAIMLPVTIIIVVIFLLFTFLNIANLIIMNNKEQEKNFGIMKAYGFTSRYIMSRNLIRIGILSGIGLSLSLIINKLITAKIFWLGLGCDGYNVSKTYTLALILGGFIAIILLAAVFSLNIRKISPKKLMEE